jgi:centromere protein S
MKTNQTKMKQTKTIGMETSMETIGVETTGVETSIEELKASVYLMVARIVDDKLQGLQGGGSNCELVVATPTFLAGLVELVYNQLILCGEDLELFANHGGRNVIKTQDLYMVTRKNDVLTKALKQFEETQRMNEHNTRQVEETRTGE